MPTRKHILVVDDERDHRELLQHYLVGEGYRVEVAGDGHDLRRAMAAGPVDLVLLDVMLPDEDGFSLARYLRTEHDCGIIMLTAKADVTDRIVGLEVGADDYLPKPFELRELLARIRSLARRIERSPHSNADLPVNCEIVCFEEWRLDRDARRLVNNLGGPVELTSCEFKLLSELISKPRQVLSREQLLLAVHNRSWDYFDRSIDVLVTRLRAKLEVDKSRPTIIKTVRGAGYVFSAQLRRSNG